MGLIDEIRTALLDSLFLDFVKQLKQQKITILAMKINESQVILTEGHTIISKEEAESKNITYLSSGNMQKLGLAPANLKEFNISS